VHAKRTPYKHITPDDGQDIYIERSWLFEPYNLDSKDAGRPSEVFFSPLVYVDIDTFLSIPIDEGQGTYGK